MNQIVLFCAGDVTKPCVRSSSTPCVHRWPEESSATWTTCATWTVLTSTPWCVTCAMSSTSPRVCSTATTSSVPAAYEAGQVTVVSAAPSVGKRQYCGSQMINNSLGKKNMRFILCTRKRIYLYFQQCVDIFFSIVKYDSFFDAGYHSVTRRSKSTDKLYSNSYSETHIKTCVSSRYLTEVSVCVYHMFMVGVQTRSF